jgi:clan AA aspartic protease (TIGR02281 family)
MLLRVDTIPNAESNAEFAYHILGQDEKAVDWVEKILQNDSTQTYDAVCTYSMVGDTAKALMYMQKTLDNGWVRFHHLEIDEDLDNIRHLDSYKRMVEKRKQEVMQNISGEKLTSSAPLRVVEVPFTSANGVTKVDCTINGLPLNFVFDTGASDVSLSQVEANFMFKNGYLNSKDVIGKQRYQTADGNISEGTVVNLRQINFGGLELKNIRASVVRSQSAPLLLGQSILQRLGKIEIDNEHKVLKITTRK